MIARRRPRRSRTTRRERHLRRVLARMAAFAQPRERVLMVARGGASFVQFRREMTWGSDIRSLIQDDFGLKVVSGIYIGDPVT